MRLDVQLYPGVYSIGISRPWYATQGMVASELTKMTGLANIVFHDRKDSASLAVNPRLDRYYSDDWDEWIDASYTGAPKTVNTEKIWAWMIVRPKVAGQAVPLPMAAPQKLTPGSASSSGKGLSTGVLLAGLALDFLIVRAVIKSARKKGARP